MIDTARHVHMQVISVQSQKKHILPVERVPEAADAQNRIGRR